MTYLLMIRGARTCCSDDTPEQAYVGVTVVHTDQRDGDGTNHELDLYWRDPPPGRRQVELVTLSPLVVAGEQTCPCGWSGTVEA